MHENVFVPRTGCLRNCVPPPPFLPAHQRLRLVNNRSRKNNDNRQTPTLVGPSPTERRRSHPSPEYPTTTPQKRPGLNSVAIAVNLKIWACNRLMSSRKLCRFGAFVHSFKPVFSSHRTVRPSYHPSGPPRYPSSSSSPLFHAYSTLHPTPIRLYPATMSPMFTEDDKLNVDRVAVIGAGPCGLAAAK